MGTTMVGSTLLASQWMLTNGIDGIQGANGSGNPNGVNSGVTLGAVGAGGGVGPIAVISNGGRTLTFSINFTPSATTTIPGWLRIHGFRFDTVPFNDTYWGDIPITVDGRNFNLVHPDTNANVGRAGAFHNSSFEFFNHARVDWELFYRTTSDVPTLVTGRNPSFVRIDGIDNRSDNPFRDLNEGIIRNHAGRWNLGTTNYWGNTRTRTADFEFSEATHNSWFSQRNTTFTLPEGVRIVAVRITDENETFGENGIFNGEDGRVFYPDDIPAAARSNVQITNSGNRGIIRFENMQRVPGEDPIVDLRFQMIVSISPNFAGDELLLNVSGEGVSSIGTVGAVGSHSFVYDLKIADVVQPVTVETDVTRIPAGLQTFDVADVIIEENAPGALIREGLVVISIEPEGITGLSHLEFTNRANTLKAEIEGDIVIDELQIAASAEETGQVLWFTVVEPSTEASRIEISGIQVITSRSAPLSTVGYRLFVSGSAIVRNHLASPRGSVPGRHPVTGPQFVFGRQWISDPCSVAGLNGSTPNVAYPILSAGRTGFDRFGYRNANNDFVGTLANDRFYSYPTDHPGNRESAMRSWRFAGSTFNNSNWWVLVEDEYIMIGESVLNPGAVSIIDQEVRMAIGRTTIMVGGVPIEPGSVGSPQPHPYRDGAMMVPIRHVAEAFGLSDEGDRNDFVYVPATRTLYFTTYNIQVTLDSPIAYRNGIAFPMVDSSGVPISAMTFGDGRIMVPFRAIGDLFNVGVRWDADTNEAVYFPIVN